MAIRITFIINPIAGSGRGARIQRLSYEILNRKRFSVSFKFTTHAGHARELAMELAMAAEADVVVAVGGDGTVNEVASGMVQASTQIQDMGKMPALAIIPMGSGNGLARHLGISLDPRKAVRSLNDADFRIIDHGLMGEHRFFCTCGVGLDADVAARFASMKGRGLITYLRACLAVWMKFKPQEYNIIYKDHDAQHTVNRKAMIITAGNANQWGNNGFITPSAKIDDGLLDVTIIKPMRLMDAPRAAYLLLHKRIYESRFAEHFRCTSLIINREREGAAHFDGEPVEMGRKIEVSLKGSSLKIFA